MNHEESESANGLRACAPMFFTCMRRVEDVGVSACCVDRACRLWTTVYGLKFVAHDERWRLLASPMLVGAYRSFAHVRGESVRPLQAVDDSVFTSQGP